MEMDKGRNKLLGSWIDSKVVGMDLGEGTG